MRTGAADAAEEASVLPPEPPPLPSPARLQELLFDAARMGREDVIPALVRAGADVEAQDDRGYTPLVLATYNGRKPAAALLLSLGASADGPADARGNSALMGVAFKGHAAIARLLLDHGADPDRRNGAGQTALMMAALFGQQEIIDLLLAAGADPAMCDAAGNCAASLAAAQGNEALADALAGLGKADGST